MVASARYRARFCIGLFRRRCVVVNDSPPLPGSFEDQSEAAMWLIARPLQMPAAHNGDSVVVDWPELQIRKRQCSHLLARVVAFNVTITHCLPTVGHAVAGHKDNRIQSSIAIHVAVNVTTIPGGALRIEYCCNGGACSRRTGS